jgi:hypothetical protein
MIIYVINYLGKESYCELGHAHHIHLHPPLLHPQVSQLKGLYHESQAFLFLVYNYGRLITSLLFGPPCMFLAWSKRLYSEIVGKE